MGLWGREPKQKKQTKNKKQNKTKKEYDSIFVFQPDSQWII